MDAEGWYPPGAEVTVEATPEPGYVFTGWTGDIGGIDDPNAASTFITMNDDATVTANFVRVYDLTMAVDPTEGGTATDETDESPYTEGTEVNIKAEANEGWEFVNWTSDPAVTFDDDEAEETTFDMPGDDVTVTANFVRVYDLTIDSTAGGEVTTPGEDTFTYDEGTVVDLEAVAVTGYEFVGWTGDIGGIDDPNEASTFITMNDDYSITAEFAEPPPVGVNINTADFDALQRIIHIGPDRAQQIIDLRADQPFCCLDDLARVDGIALGGSRLQEIKDQGIAYV